MVENGHVKAEDAQIELLHLKAQLRNVDEKRDDKLKRKPPGKQLTTSALEQNIRAKESEMQHSSLTIQQEKVYLKQIKLMKDEKKALDLWEKEMEDLRTRRSQIQEQMRLVSERQDAARTVQLLDEAAQLLQLPLESVVEARVPVSEEMAEMLTTPMWSKRMRTDYAVTSHVMRKKPTGVRLLGAQASVDAASAFLQGYGTVVSHPMAVSDEELGLLIGKKGATIAQLQEETECCFVLDKKNSSVAVLGLAAAVESALVQVREIFETRRRVEVTLRYSAEQKGTLLGKGGATINRISTESGAQLELGKDPECSVRIHGLAPAVAVAQELLEGLLFLKAECVQVLEMPVDVVDAVMGKGGEHVRQLQSTHTVGIDWLRAPGAAGDARGDRRHKSGAASRASPTPESGVARVKVRGSKEGVAAALREMREVIERERKVEAVVHVQSQHVGMLLGKGGATINAVQKESGALLDMQKKADEGSSVQAVTIRGNAAQVKRAQAALEAVLKYDAESNAVLVVDAAMMPLLIGKGGEEINRIRSVTGAAIDAERDEKKPQFKLRGSKEAVEAARAALLASIESNTRVGVHVPLPWHCMDVLVGRNGESLRKLEADYQVQMELPGQSLESEQVGSGSFLAITTSLLLRGRKKHVDAAALKLERLSSAYATEEVQLDNDDARLLAQLCLAEEMLLEELERAHGVRIRFEPVEGVLRFRGESRLAASRSVRELLRCERPTELIVPCEATPLALLRRADGAELRALQALCAPVDVQLAEAAVRLFAKGRLLPAAQQAAEAWIEEHREAVQTLAVPPEVQAGFLRDMPRLQAAHGVVGKLEQMALSIRGPHKHVSAAVAEARQYVRLHAHVEVTLALGAEDLALVELRARKQPADAPKLEVLREQGLARLRGNELAVEHAKAALEALLAEAAQCAVTLPCNKAQLVKLTQRPPPSRQGGRGASLLHRLQDTHDCALVPAPDAQLLHLRGRAAAVARMQQALEQQLDVDQHEREVATHMVPVIIGKGGATIRRLGEQSGGAEFKLDSSTGRLSVTGRKAAVAKAVALLDELVEQFGGARTVPIEERQIALIIGRGGATIKQLQADSGATINILKEQRCLEVRGSHQAVDAAVQLISAKLSAAPPGREKASRPPPGLGAPAPRTETRPAAPNGAQPNGAPAGLVK